MHPDKLLDLAAALRVVTPLSRVHPGDGAASAIPRALMSYWDSDPPAQILALFERSESLCARHGIAYTRFDNASARAFLAEHCSDRFLQAYDIAPHPSMKSDLFRLCYLVHRGGYYMDAGFALQDSFPGLFHLPGEAVVFKRTSRNKKLIFNGLIGATQGSPLIRMAMRTTARSIANACRIDREEALRTILGVSGPGLFTRIVGTYIATVDPQGKPQVTVSTEDQAYSLIQPGARYLGRALEYRRTEKHWSQAIKITT